MRVRDPRRVHGVVGLRPILDPRAVGQHGPGQNHVMPAAVVELRLVALGVVVYERAVGGVRLEALERAEWRRKTAAQRTLIRVASAVAVYEYIGVAGHDDLAEAERSARDPVAVNVEGDLRAGLVPNAGVVVEEQAQVDAATVHRDAGRGELEIVRTYATVHRASVHLAALAAGAERSVVVGFVPSGI